MSLDERIRLRVIAIMLDARMGAVTGGRAIPIPIERIHARAAAARQELRHIADAPKLGE
jgi:hypothetical protein